MSRVAPPMSWSLSRMRLAQLEQVDAGRLGQLLGLEGGQPRPVGDEVAGQLGGEAGAGRAHVQHEAADDVEDGADAVDLLVGAADHADELARPPPRPGRR